MQHVIVVPLLILFLGAFGDFLAQSADSSDERSVVISPAGFKEAFEDGYRLGLVDGFKARVGDKDDK